MSAFVEFQKVNKEYRNGDVTIDALNDVNFTVEQGEFCVVYGGSASGKSTLLGVLAGVEGITSGKFFVDGDRVSRFSKKELTEYRAKEIGYVSHSLDLLPGLTAIENVEAGTKFAEDPADAFDVLDRLGLEERVNSYPVQLSFGEQQKVALARAIAKNPKLLLWDEPTSYLDADTCKSIFSLIAELCRSEGMTVIVATHSKAMASVADRIINMKDGEVLSSELNENPAPYDSLDW